MRFGVVSVEFGVFKLKNPCLRLPAVGRAGRRTKCSEFINLNQRLRLMWS